jgi:hypothetical protein
LKHLRRTFFPAHILGDLSIVESGFSGRVLPEKSAQMIAFPMTSSYLRKKTASWKNQKNWKKPALN